MKKTEFTPDKPQHIGVRVLAYGYNALTPAYTVKGWTTGKTKREGTHTYIEVMAYWKSDHNKRGNPLSTRPQFISMGRVDLIPETPEALEALAKMQELAA